MSLRAKRSNLAALGIAFPRNAGFHSVVKTAIVEVLEERSELIRNIVEEALEDIGISKAIQEGEDSALITRHQVFSLVEDQ